MEESLKWLAVNAGQITVTGLLAVFLVVGALAVQRKWVIPGWLYAKCVARQDELEKKAEALAAANEIKIAKLEAENAGRRAAGEAV